MRSHRVPVDVQYTVIFTEDERTAYIKECEDILTKLQGDNHPTIANVRNHLRAGG